MSHDAARVAIVQDPAQGFGQIVSGVDNARHVVHDDIAGILPILDGKVLDIDMTGTLGGDLGVDHIDRRHIVLIDWGRPRGRKTKLRENGSEVLGVFGGRDSAEKLSLSGAGGCDGLSLTAVAHSAPSKEEGIPSSGSAIAKIVGMCSIDETFGFKRTSRIGEWRKYTLSLHDALPIWKSVV